MKESLKTSKVLRFVSLFGALILTVAGLSFTNAGCSGGSEGNGDYTPPVFAAADPSQSCPAGYVGWDFANAGSLAQDGGAMQPIQGVVTVVQTWVAGMTESNPMNAAYTRALKAACDGQGSCTDVGRDAPIDPLGVPGGIPEPYTATIAYTCSNSGSTELRVKVPLVGNPHPASRPGGVVGIDYPAIYFPATIACPAQLERESIPTGKACVPATCPENTVRNSHLQCVVVPKPKLDPMVIANVTVRDVPGQKMGRETDLSPAIIGGLDYEFRSAVFVKATRPKSAGPLKIGGRLLYWATNRFSAPDGTVVEGFRCTAGGIDLGDVGEKVAPSNWAAGDILSLQFSHILKPAPDCFSRESFYYEAEQAHDEKAIADAARRAELTKEEFLKKFHFDGVRIHASFDVDGATVPDPIQSSRYPASCAGCQPNPVGFFGRSWGVDMIGYYQQREATAAAYPNGYATDSKVITILAPTSFEALAATTTRGGFAWGLTVSPPTYLRLIGKEMHANKLEVTISKFGRSRVALPVTVSYAVSGNDNERNPFVVQQPGETQVGPFWTRDARIEVFATIDGRAVDPNQKPHPSGSSVLLGSFPLSGVTETKDKSGKVVTTRVNGDVSATLDPYIERAAVPALFELYKTSKQMRVFYCLTFNSGDSLQKMSTGKIGYQVVESLPYGAGIANDCVFAPETIGVHLDTLRRSTPPAGDSADLKNVDDKNSGDAAQSGKQSNLASAKCTGSTCTRSQTAGMGGSGGVLSKKMFGASVDSDESEDANGARANGQLTGEAIGFTVVDLDEPDDEVTWDPSKPPSVQIPINVDFSAIEAALRYSLHGTPIEADKRRFSGGRDGIGIAFKFKSRLQIGPIPGEVEIGIGAAVTVGLTLKLEFAPGSEYPCLNQGNEKCYGLVEASSYGGARTACANKGGYLAEPRTLQELTNIQEALRGEEAPFDTTPAWLGGQLAYDYPRANCPDVSSPADKDACVREAKRSFRWVTDDKEFATGTGFVSGVAATDFTFLTPNGASMLALYPTSLKDGLLDDSGVFMDVTNTRLATAVHNSVMRGICEFPPATKEKYRSFGGALQVGASAGLSMAFCTPSSDIGICIEAGINFVEFNVTPTTTIEQRTLTAPGGNAFNIGGVKVAVPWSLSLLSGSVSASFNAWLFSITKEIVAWKGFEIASGSLFDDYLQVVKRP